VWVDLGEVGDLVVVVFGVYVVIIVLDGLVFE